MEKREPVGLFCQCAKGWSIVCDCGISLSYSLAFLGCCPFNAVVLLLLIHYVPIIVCGGSVFGLCFVMHYFVSFLALQSS